MNMQKMEEVAEETIEYSAFMAQKGASVDEIKESFKENIDLEGME